MSDSTEEEKLLQDASALLMFANVAAKQQQEQLKNTPLPRMETYGTASPNNDDTRTDMKKGVAKITTNSIDPADGFTQREAVTDGPSDNQVGTEIETLLHAEIPTIRSAPPVESNPTNKSYEDTTVSNPLLEEHLPVKGNFTQTHKRSSSTPEISQTLSSYQMHRSPGPANVALARGINLETGERNNKNAMIAAAALAAAADIPLPLKQVESNELNMSDSKNDMHAEDQLTEPEEEDITEEEIPSGRKQEERSKTIPNDVLALNIDSPNTFKVPPLNEYQVDPDSGLIGCICGIDEDDGFTVQCDICYRWQHCVCMGFESSDEVPEDEYKCFYCDHNKWGKIRADVCRENTLRRLDAERSVDNRKPNNGKRKQSTGKSEKQDKRKKSNVTSETSAKDLPDSMSKNRSLGSPIPPAKLSVDIEPDNLPNPNNELLNDGSTAEAYQSVYYKLLQNDYKTTLIKELLEKSGNKFFQEHKLSKNSLLTHAQFMSPTQFDSIKFSKIILPNHEMFKSQADIKTTSKGLNKTSIQVKSYNENQKLRFNGISKLGLFIKREHWSGDEEYVIPQDTPIIEYLGEVDYFDNYAKDPINQYSSWGTTKPKVVRTSLDLENKIDLIIDSRFVGNESRFIRKSCPSSSNCKLNKIYIPSTKSFKFIIATSKPIKLTDTNEEELRLEWDWDSNHPILKFYENENLKFDQLSDSDKSFLITNTDKILHFVECGCSTSASNANCALFKIKKATSYLMRSTRKAASISNVNLNKSKEELFSQEKPPVYRSWKERLDDRDETIQMKLSITTDEKKESDQEEHCALDTDSGSHEVEEKSIFFHVPYKQQLISRTNIRGVSYSRGNKKIDTRFLETKGIPVPISSKLYDKIEVSVNKKLNIAPKEQSNPNNEKEETKRAASTIRDHKEDSNGKIRGSPENHQVKSTNVDSAPPIKKKLSFADYKKKMK
ncbi:uncharacterized protein PRCAT00005897001 [Priceomyces carsonii]|uniref:uncharacterized protein n=1 Tax=Priceomyces carsonii TaxID=28549 RepID=UPI002EDAD1D9|nr:unnamed protein product [Priceomyces carsonii]